MPKPLACPAYHTNLPARPISIIPMEPSRWPGINPAPEPPSSLSVSATSRDSTTVAKITRTGRVTPPLERWSRHGHRPGDLRAAGERPAVYAVHPDLQHRPKINFRFLSD